MIFKQTYKIRLSNIGKGNFITNKGILDAFENIGEAHSSQIGYGIKDIEKTHASWIVIDWQVKVLHRPKYGQNLNIHTWARNTKYSYTYRDYIIYDDDGTKMVIATSKWALIDLQNGKLMRLNSNIIDKFNPEEKNSVFNINELDKLKEPNHFENIISYKVKRSDIDINKHMHNLYYLDLAYDALPEEIYDNKQFDEIRITYKREIKLGETVICKYTFENNKHIVTIFDESETKVHSIIQLQ